MSDDKTEEPTDQKLRQAREQGQVPKSQDLTLAASMAAVVGTLMMTGEAMGGRVRRIVTLALDFGADGDLPLIDIYRRIGSMALEGALAIMVPVVVAAVAAIAGAAAQVGLQVSMEAVSPKPDAVDPMAGLKRMFSVKSLLTLVQMLVKAVVLGAVLWTLVVGLMPMLANAMYQSLGTISVISWTVICQVLACAMVLFLVFGPVDYAIQRWQFMKDQRMSKDEIKREHKSSEGDPQLKGKRKQIAKEDARSPPPRKAVAGANAVVVNPTHYAVAIRYRAEEFGLPLVVAKGVDEQAMQIRRMAEELGVPVFTNPPLARSLHRVPEGGAVPEELFESVAAVLRWVDEIGRSKA